MVSLIQGLFIPTYNLAKGRDIHSGVSLSYSDARIEAKKLLNAVFKVSMGVGGFFTLSALLHKISPNHSLLGTCVLTAGGVVLSQRSVSPLVAQGSAIAAGLFIVKVGVNLIASPFVQSVKAALHWIAEPHVSLNLLSSCGSGIALGYLRLAGCLTSFGLGLYVMDRTSQQRTKSKHLVDRGIRYLSKKCASGLIALLGYKKYTPPALIQPVRLFQK